VMSYACEKGRKEKLKGNVRKGRLIKNIFCLVRPSQKREDEGGVIMEKTGIKTIYGLELRAISRALRALIVAQVFLLVIGVQAWGGHDYVKNVNCNKGETITDALQKFDGKPITIEVKGTCNENVTIDRNDVTLIAHPSGGAVSGVEPIDATIIINGDRAVIDGLTVTGGGGGIRVLGKNNMIRNCIVQNVGANGIPFPGGTGTVDNCTIQNSGQNGVNVFNGGGVTVTNSTIQNNGIHGVNISDGGRATVTNSTISSNNSHGISFYKGGLGTVDQCTVQSNAGHGIRIEAASATVINSMISSNTRCGIMVTKGGDARIGISDPFQYAGNTISNNQGNGIQLFIGGSAYIGGNTITGNGTNPNSVHGPFGVGIFSSNAVLVGNNRITGSGGVGVFIVGSSVDIGNPGMGLPTTGDFANVISGNANGINGTSGASLSIRDAIINGNTGNGVTLAQRSTANISGGTIDNNTGNGILLTVGGGLVVPIAGVTVTGNTLFGLQCTDNESSFIGNISGISGNTGGDVSPSCTGF
jgi:hypothetical protein